MLEFMSKLLIMLGILAVVVAMLAFAAWPKDGNVDAIRMACLAVVGIACFAGSIACTLAKMSATSDK